MNIAKEILRQLAAGWRSPINTELTQEMMEEAATVSPPLNVVMYLHNYHSDRCVIPGIMFCTYALCGSSVPESVQHWVIIPADGYPGHYMLESGGLCMYSYPTEE